MTDIRVGIVGATGYLGTELLRNLLAHPDASVAALASATRAGKPVASSFPTFGKRLGARAFVPMTAEALSDVDVALLATPSGVARELAPALLEAGVRVVDLSGDHRLSRGAAKKHYGADPIAEGAVYGLPELNAARIRTAKLVANPGCYPTATLLAALPLAQAGLVEEPVVVTALSGASGAGREPSGDLHYPEMNESARAYKVGTHRHEPEIAETLSFAAGRGLRVSFTPHIVPMNRGIVATVHAKPRGPALESGELGELYAKAYAEAPFVEVVDWEPDTKHVRGTNLCHVKPHAANAAGLYVVTSAIDNLVKGGAGQAIQNVNLMFGLPETAGLPILGGGP